MVNSYEKPGSSCSVRVCQEAVTSGPLDCPLEAPPAPGLLIGPGLVLSSSNLQSEVLGDQPPVESGLLPPELRQPGPIGKMACPSLVGPLLVLGQPGPIGEIAAPPLAGPPHMLGQPGPLAHRASPPSVEPSFIISFLPSDLKTFSATSALDVCAQLPLKSYCLDRLVPGKLFSYRRSLRLATKNKGVHKSSLLKAKELMCRKLKLARLASKLARPTASSSLAASTSSSCHQSTLPLFPGARASPKAADLNPAHSLSQEEIQHTKSLAVFSMTELTL